MQKIVSEYVSMWEGRCYRDGIPDDSPREIFDKVPSYKKIAMAILKNDPELLGVIPKPCTAYVAIKRAEIQARSGYKKSNQLQLF